MSKIVWGAEIAVDGVKPDWLADNTSIQWWSSDTYGGMTCKAGELKWDTTDGCDGVPGVKRIRLPVDHFAYLAIAKGFEPWGGGDSAPDDWDGGEALFRDGAVFENPPTLARWTHRSSVGDIIGYKRRAEAVSDDLAQSITVTWRREGKSGLGYHTRTEPNEVNGVFGYLKRIEPTAPVTPELVERMVKFVRFVADEDGNICEVCDEARAILAELEPSPVERFKRENPNLSPDELLAKALEGREA